MDGVILYQSKYGAAKKYADWLAEETGYPCMETKKADIKEIEKYDTIILGGGIYASGIAGLSFLKRNIGKLTGKRFSYSAAARRLMKKARSSSAESIT